MPDIIGYRALTDADVEVVNTIKAAEVDMGDLWRQIKADRPDCDPRWMAVAKTHLQEGFTAFVRAITRPTDPF